MTNVDKVIARYAYGESVKMGVVPDFPSAQLRNDLKAVVRSNRIYFNVLFGSLVAVMILILVLVAYFVREPKSAAAVIAASGVSLPFVLRLLVQLWQAKVQSEALITLSTHLEPALMRGVVKAFAQGMKVSSAAAAN